MNLRPLGWLLAIITAVSGCRVEEDSEISLSPDMGGVFVGADCPLGASETTFTVCELKRDGNPRQPRFGEAVQVSNVVVTTDPFSLTQTSTSGLNGFYVQDRATNAALQGRYAGIIVTYRPDIGAEVPSRGDIVSVTGTLRDFGPMGGARQKQLELGSFTGAGNETPIPLRVGNPSMIGARGPDARAYEGVLVEVENVTAVRTRDIPGAGGATIFGAFEVTGDLVVRNTLTAIQADDMEPFRRIAGILTVGTSSFDAGIHALAPRDGGDYSSALTTVRRIGDLQDPAASGRPDTCTQRGAASTRTGTCPRVRLENVVITAVEGVEDGRATMWIQDPSVADGRFAGVRVFGARIEGMGAPTVGDVVNVEGIAMLFFDGLQIADASATLTAYPSAPLAPIVVSPDDLPGRVEVLGGEVRNPYEGVLVRIENVTVTNRCIESNGDRGYFEVAGTTIVGNEFDYAYNGGTPTDTSDPGPCSSRSRPGDQRADGDSFASISGIMDYSFNQFRLNPRSDADLVP